MAELTKMVYRGRGKVYIDGRYIGNCNELTIGAEQEESTLTDYTTAGGGTYASSSIISTVPVTGTVYDYLPENLALAMLGTTTGVTAGTVTGESITAPADLSSGDRLVRTANLLDTAESVTLTSDPAGTTYTADTDYTVTAAGVILLAAGGIADSADLLISYTKKASTVIEALTATSQEHELVYDGINIGSNGEPGVVVVPKFKLAPSEIPLISEDFGQLTLNGQALADPAKNGTTASKYYQWISA